MLAMIAFIIKLIIGGAASYIIPSVSKKNISEKEHLKILCVGIFSTSLFSITYAIDSQAPYIFSASALVFIGFLSFRLSESMKLDEKILLFGCVLIGLNIGFGYILQGIILSFLVYYIISNRADLFTLLYDNKDDSIEEDIN